MRKLSALTAVALFGLTPQPAHAGCAEVLAELGTRVADVACFHSDDLTTANPLTTPANNSLPGVPPSAFTPITDRAVFAPSAGQRTPITKTVPGIQVNGRFADDPTEQARFLLRLPDDWNGRLVVAGAAGTRSEFSGDFAWSDYVVQKGYAYASQNKGVLNLQIAALNSATPPDAASCRLNPLSTVWVRFYDTAPDKPFTQWTQYMIAAAELAQEAARANYHPSPRKRIRTYAVGTANGGYQVRRAIELAPGTFDGGVDWEGTFVDPNGPNLLVDLPPAIANFGIDDGAIEAAGYPPNIVNGALSLYGTYSSSFWEITQCQWQKRFDPSWVTYPGGQGDVSGTGGYDYASRAAADPAIPAALADVATTGKITRPLITVAGTMDALHPIERHARAYEALVKASSLGRKAVYRLYEVQNGNHVETYADQFPQLRIIEPHAQRAFDLLVDHVETGAPLPPSQCIGLGAAIDANPATPGHCPSLLAP